MNILEFAINMEKEGEAFYLSQAKENENNGLFSVFSILAEDEKQHAEILTDFQNKETANLPESGLSVNTSIFKGQIKSDIKQTPAQLDAYREALKKEQESIDLYKDLLDKSEIADDTDIFGYLIKQEELHYTIIEDIIFHLEKAESWVESAEFGVREDY